MNKTMLLAAVGALLSVQLNIAAADATGSSMPAHATHTSSGGADQNTISPAVHQQFTRLDSNKDGYLEKNEVAGMKQLSKSFTTLSKNGKLDEISFAMWEKSGRSTPTKVN